MEAETPPAPGRSTTAWVPAALAAAAAGAVGVLVGVLVAVAWLAPHDPTADQAGQDGVTAVADAVLPSVVRVDVQGIGDGGSGNGSGVVLDGHVVTNHHVVAGATRVEVTARDGGPTTAVVVGSDPRTDVAVLRVPGLDAPALEVAVGAVRVGQVAVAVGSPFGLTGTVTAGVVSAVDRPIDLRTPDGQVVRLPRVLQTDAGVDPGSSGGPLVDARGRMIGLTSAVLGGGTGGEVGFAVPADVVREAVDRLLSAGSAPAPYLGLSGTTVAREGPGGGTGALVERVDPGSPAAVAGLQAGDVLTEAGGQVLAGVDDLARVVAEAGVGATIDLRYLRDGSVHTTDATLGVADDDS